MHLHTFGSGLLRWLRDSTQLLAPRLCTLCGSPVAPAQPEVCASCLAQLPYCPAWTDTPWAPLRQRLAEYGADVEAVFARLWYVPEGSSQLLVWQAKYAHQPRLLRSLGSYWAPQLPWEQLPQDLVVCAVPLHRRKFWRRGYNQSEWWAQGLCAATGWAFRPQLLRRCRHTPSQTGKNKAERRQNMDQAFAVRGSCPPHVLITDDVLTSGATLASCILALKAAGAQRVWVAVVCAVPDG